MEKWQHPEIIILWTALILILIVILISTLGVMFFLAYRKSMRQRAKDYKDKLDNELKLHEKGFAVEKQERERIAAELHDNIISKLTVIRLKSTIKYDFREIDALLGETIDETRRISHELAPPSFEVRGIQEILDEIIQRWSSEYEITKNFNISGYHLIKKAPEVKFHIIRILQELLQNIHKHSQATQIKILYKESVRCTAFVVSDNGIGFTSLQNSGLGMQNIDSRAKATGASYKFVSKENKGTRFIFSLDNGKN